jgi:putative membrane protein
MRPDGGPADDTRDDLGRVAQPRAGEQPGQPAPADPVAATAPDKGAPELPHHKIHRTRISGTWVAISLFTLVLLLLLIFILQNSRTVDVSYFGMHGHLPLGVALLLAAVCGILLLACAGSARIIQLRSTARKHRRTDANAAPARR